LKSYLFLKNTKWTQYYSEIKVKLPAASRGASLLFLSLLRHSLPREGNSKDAIHPLGKPRGILACFGKIAGRLGSLDV
jgi:hypothetical protein